MYAGAAAALLAPLLRPPTTQGADAYGPNPSWTREGATALLRRSEWLQGHQGPTSLGSTIRDRLITQPR
jgi:hypothetical protein